MCYKTLCQGEYLDVMWNELEKVDKCVMRKCIICTRQRMSFDQIDDDEGGNAYSTHV
jgi:hypothetical protein